MDEAGIDKAVLFYSDDIGNGHSDDVLLEINRHVSRISERHPGRIIPFASVDPRRAEAPELLRRCIEEYGMRGLKWHPDYGFYPNSEASFRVLEVASERGVPLITHSGPLPGVRSEYAHPIHLDDVASSFPELPVIAAHMGDTWWREWLAIVQYKRNIYGDLAMWQFTAETNMAKLRAVLREVMDSVGPGQVLFATDAPAFEAIVSNRTWVDAVKSLSGESDDDIRFTQGEVDAILGGNAEKILKI
jgi:predicted TIM-barrel fold metal-dependent hydrolase